jgi:hypothetical protein
MSRKVASDEDSILELIREAGGLAGEARWAVDISGRLSALLLALLLDAGQQVVYVPGRTVSRMSGAFAGEGKTDAKDAQVIADTARMRAGGREELAEPVMAARPPGRGHEHRLGRSAPRDQHGRPLQRRLGVRECAQVLFPAHPAGIDRLVVDGCRAAHRRAGGCLLKQVVERLALAVIERAEHLVLDR